MNVWISSKNSLHFSSRRSSVALLPASPSPVAHSPWRLCTRRRPPRTMSTRAWNRFDLWSLSLCIVKNSWSVGRLIAGSYVDACVKQVWSIDCGQCRRFVRLLGDWTGELHCLELERWGIEPWIWIGNCSGFLNINSIECGWRETRIAVGIRLIYIVE